MNTSMAGPAMPGKARPAGNRGKGKRGPGQRVIEGANFRLVNEVRYTRAAPGHSPPPSKSKVDHLMQDIVITTLVLTLVERFPPLKPTRRQTGWKRRPSACSIAAQVMSEIGLHRGG